MWPVGHFRDFRIGVVCGFIQQGPALWQRFHTFTTAHLQEGLLLLSETPGWVQMEPSSPSYWNKINKFLFRATYRLLKRSITKDFTFNSECCDLTLQKALAVDVIGERINMNNADRMGESAPWERHFQRLFMRNSYKDKIMFLHSSIHSSRSTFRGKRLFIKSTIEMFC